MEIFEACKESSEDEEEKAEKKSLNERQARLKKELNDESNNGKTIEESNSEASSSEEDCDDPNDPDIENSSEMKKQLASLEDNEFCGRDSGCTCILALYQVRIIIYNQECQRIPNGPLVMMNFCFSLQSFGISVNSQLKNLVDT